MSNGKFRNWQEDDIRARLTEVRTMDHARVLGSWSSTKSCLSHYEHDVVFLLGQLARVRVAQRRWVMLVFVLVACIFTIAIIERVR